MNNGLALILAVFSVLTATVLAGDAKGEQPVVGAIRWDAWFKGNDFGSNLAPQEWRYRLPFYHKEINANKVEVRGDSQKVMDREIAFAKDAGLSYWAFCYYHPKSWGKADSYNYGLKLYLSSRHKADLNFCLILLGGCVGPSEEWPTTVDFLVKLFKEPTYQKVSGGRPLLYTFAFAEELPKFFGSEAAARQALDLLRKKSLEAGLKPPYMVTQVWNAKTGAEYVDRFGFDAISAYAWADFSHSSREYPYSALAIANRDYWEACKATGKKAIPIVSTGWDNRPRWRDAKRYEQLYKSPPGGPWYHSPTPQELAGHLQAALEWNKRNPNCAEANAVIIYAWNEFDEGGWLAPTKSEGNARLKAVQKVLKGR